MKEGEVQKVCVASFGPLLNESILVVEVWNSTASDSGKILKVNFLYLTLSARDAYIYAQKSPTLHRGMHIYVTARFATADRLRSRQPASKPARAFRVVRLSWHARLARRSIEQAHAYYHAPFYSIPRRV